MYQTIDDDVLYKTLPVAEKLMLEQIPTESELSHIFSKRFERKMKALLKYERRTPAMRNLVRYFKTAVAAILIVSLISFATIMSVEAYRIRLFNFVVTTWDKLTSIVIESEENVDIDRLVPRESSYVPEGYVEVERSLDRYEQTIIYANIDGDELLYSQKLLTQGEYILDTENTEMIPVDIDSQRIYVIQNKGITQISWHDTEHSYYLMGAVEKNEFLRMAEEIIKK